MSFVAVIISGVSAWVTITNSMSSDARNEALFGTMIEPVVQETPILAVFEPSTNMVTLIFEMTNITNFVARNVSIDARFDNVWISEWVRAKMDDLTKKHSSTVHEERLLKRWESEARRRKEFSSIIGPAKSDTTGITGAIDVGRICGPPGATSEVVTPFRTRTTWRNDRQRHFNRMSSYELVCTRVDSGKSIMFLLTDEEDPRKIP